MDEPGPTDVLAFPMDELDISRGPQDDEQEAGPALLGDVVLCPAVAAKQAIEAGHSTEDELHLLGTHGILHLLGYDHAEPDEAQEMFGLQAELLDGLASRPQRCRARERIAVSLSDLALLVASIVLVLLAGVVAASEAALTRVSRVRVDELVARTTGAAGATCAGHRPTRAATSTCCCSSARLMRAHRDRAGRRSLCTHRFGSDWAAVRRRRRRR